MSQNSKYVKLNMPITVSILNNTYIPKAFPGCISCTHYEKIINGNKADKQTIQTKLGAWRVHHRLFHADNERSSTESYSDETDSENEYKISK